MMRSRRWLLVAVFTTIAVRAVAQDADRAPFPAPGRMIDVGGWKLHLNCSGKAVASQPTVILESGIGDFSVEWSLVQPGVAQFARVCSYDRAGDGWSELDPHPRTMHQIVHELHTLLDRAGERAPYVLVGHSYGGWLVRLYQSTYPSDVAGMVLVDAGADNPLRMLSDGRVAHAADLPAGRPAPPIKTGNPLTLADIPPAAFEQMTAGIPGVVAHANDGPRAKLPPDAQRMRLWVLGRWQHIAAAVNQFDTEELLALRRARLAQEHSLGALPLIVITRGLPEEQGPDAAEQEAEHRGDHAALAAMSTKGEQIIATKSAHHIQLDEPELVVATVKRVVTATRK